MLSFGIILRNWKKIHRAVKRNLEEAFHVKAFLKMSIGFECRCPKVELQFWSVLGRVHFSSTPGADKRKQLKHFSEQKIVCR